MTIPIPTELEQALVERARLRRQSVEEIVRDALESYLRTESDDELNAWQEAARRGAATDLPRLCGRP